MANRLFFQVDIGWYENRKVRKAGAGGWLVFGYLLSKHRANPAMGWVDKSDAHPEQIATSLGHLLASFALHETDETHVTAETLLRSCNAAGLIDIHQSGAVFIRGWEDWHGPKSSSERVRRHREKIAPQNASHGAQRGNAIACDAAEGAIGDASGSDPGVSHADRSETFQALQSVSSVTERSERSALSSLLSSRSRQQQQPDCSELRSSPPGELSGDTVRKYTSDDLEPSPIARRVAELRGRVV